MKTTNKDIILIITLILSVHFTELNSITKENKSNTLSETEELNIPTGYINIVESNDAFCASAPIKSGKIVVQSTCSSTDLLLWKIIPVKGGYRIQSKNGLFLETSKGKLKFKTKIIAVNEEDSNNQIWKIKKASKGRFFIETRKKKGVCLANKNRIGYGSIFNLMYCGENTFELFRLMDPVATIVIPETYGLMKGPMEHSVSYNNLCMMAPEKSGEKVREKDCQKDDSRLWKFVAYSYGYIIKSKSGLVMENRKGDDKDNNPVVASIENKKDEQIFIPELYENGAISFRNPATNLCIETFSFLQPRQSYYMTKCAYNQSNQIFNHLALPRDTKDVRIPKGWFNIVDTEGKCISGISSKTLPCGNGKAKKIALDYYKI